MLTELESKHKPNENSILFQSLFFSYKCVNNYVGMANNFELTS